MKRVALLCVGLALGAASAAEAQLTMQMSNGWAFTFSGNVNAFAIYESQSDEGGTTAPGGLVGVGGKGFNLRTGLLPAFAVFDAKGKEGNTDLGVHFGFAPGRALVAEQPFAFEIGLPAVGEGGALARGAQVMRLGRRSDAAHVVRKERAERGTLCLLPFGA